MRRSNSNLLTSIVPENEPVFLPFGKFSSVSSTGAWEFRVEWHIIRALNCSGVSVFRKFSRALILDPSPFHITFTITPLVEKLKVVCLPTVHIALEWRADKENPNETKFFLRYVRHVFPSSSSSSSRFLRDFHVCKLFFPLSFDPDVRIPPLIFAISPQPLFFRSLQSLRSFLPRKYSALRHFF